MKRAAYILILSFLLTGGCHKVAGPPEPDNGISFGGCILPGSRTTLDIMSFNIESFPMQGALSVDAVAQLIKAADPDVVALQEITSEAAFNSLLGKLPGWTGQYYLINNADWNLAWLFKDSEVSFSPSSARLLFAGDFYAFPRPAFEVRISHKATGINAWLINLHLKCCGGTDNIARRREAALMLHDYIVTERNEDAVIVLGDWNDVIGSSYSTEHPFHVFLSRGAEYRFADMHIADGSPLWWSYPSWPSHIDHIMVSNELFGRIDTALTHKPEPCYPAYSTVISDHRPVGLVLK